MKKTMHKVKRGIILLTLCTIASSCRISAIHAEDVKSAEPGEAYKMARVMLDGIVETELFPGDIGSTVSRGEFTDAAIKLIRLDITAGDESPVFADVPNTHEYFEAIQTAYDMNWVSEAEKFEPDRAITLQEAMKIILCAADYREMAEQYGGYPAGYTDMANSLDLFQNVKADDEQKLTREAGVNLFYNVLKAKSAEKTFVGKDITYKLSNEDNLSKIYDMYLYDGIITSTTYNSLLMNQHINNNGEISIDGETCQYGQMDDDMLGKKVRAACRKDGGDVFVACVYPLKNEEKTIQCDDFDEINGTRLFYYEADQRKKITLDGSYVTVYNGRRVEKPENNMISGADGKLRFLDNDKDGEYEVVFIEQYQYGKIASVDSTNSTLSLKHNQKADAFGTIIELGVQDNYLSVRDSEGKSLELFELEPGSVVAVKQSKDLLYNEVILCEKTVSGQIINIDLTDDTVRLDEAYYPMTLYFKEQYLDSIKPGTYATLTLGINDTVICADSQGTGYEYGFLVNAWLNDASDGIGIKLYDGKGSFLIYDAADKVKLDGVRTDSLKLIEKLTATGGGELPQLLRFSLNADGKISGLDTAEEGGDATFGKSQPADNSLAAYTFGASLQYKSGVQSFPGFCNVSRAVIFKIPNDVTDTDLFDIWNVSQLNNDDRYTFVAYNLDENGFADVLLMRSDDTGLQERTSSIMVEKVRDAVTPDGDIGLEISGWAMGKYVSYYINPEDVQIKKKSGSTLCCGDIIRAYVDANGTVKDVVVDFDADADTFSPNSSNGGATFNGTNAVLMYQEGGLYSVGSGMVYISNVVAKEGDVTGSGDDAFKELPTYDYSFSNLRNYKLNTKYIVLCDRKHKQIRPITENELKSYVGSGDDEHYVILRQNAFSAICMFVYE